MNPPSDREALEAHVRQLMAQHAAINPRGWTTTRQRRDLHTQIDTALDQHAAGGIDHEWLEHMDAPHGDPAATHCGECGRARYKSTRGAIVCGYCDGQAMFTVEAEWESLA